MACSPSVGDCELHGPWLERGFRVARCDLCAVTIIGMAMSQD